MMMTAADKNTRAAFYRFLSRLYRAEADEALLEQLKQLSFPPAGQPALAEGYSMMSAWLSNCGDNALENLAVDYAAVFLAAGSNDGNAAIPCESVYTSGKKLVMQEAWEAVRQQYAQHGMAKGSAFSDLMEDHLAIELEFMAHLVRTGSPEAQKRFVQAHLLNWLEPFTADIDRFARENFYKALGRMTLGFIQAEEALLTALTDGALREAPSYSVRQERMNNIFARLSRHYRVYAPMRDPRSTGQLCYGEVSALTDIVCAGNISLFPDASLFLTVREPDDPRELILFARACDISALRGAGVRARFFLLECREGCDRRFCAATDPDGAGAHSAVFRIDDICALVEVRDEKFLPYFADEVPISFSPAPCPRQKSCD